MGNPYGIMIYLLDYYIILYYTITFTFRLIPLGKYKLSYLLLPSYSLNRIITVLLQMIVLAWNKPQRLICHKTKKSKQTIYIFMLFHSKSIKFVLFFFSKLALIYLDNSLDIFTSSLYHISYSASFKLRKKLLIRKYWELQLTHLDNSQIGCLGFMAYQPLKII